LKYSVDETLKEVTKRRKTIVRDRFRKTARALSAVCMVLFVSVAAVIYNSASVMPVRLRTTSMGAFLLPAGAGGYIIAAVLAFLLGVFFTVLVIKYRDSRHG